MRGSLAVWIVGAFALAVAAIAIGSLVSGPTIRNAASWFAVYFVIWWLVIFAVLPLGVQKVERPENGHDFGAPLDPMLWRKVALTSIIAFLVWGAYFIATRFLGFSLLDLRK